jgi:hydrogenase maturation protein HypF
MRLESRVSRPEALPDGFTLTGGVLDFRGLLAALADCDDPVTGANWLHGTLLAALSAWAADAAARTGVDTVALAGGCFMNQFLAGALPPRLSKLGLRPLLAEGVPPNDGSISLGQAWVARRQSAAHKPQLEVLS